WTTPTRPPRRRSARCWPGCPPMVGCRGLCSMVAMTSAQLTLDLAGLPAGVLVRLRSDRCFYADPPPRLPGTTGRPRRHGAKFNLADPTTWPAPTATLVCADEQYGIVTVAAWSGLHPKQRHRGHRTRGPRPIVRGTVIRVAVQRVPARTRPPTGGLLVLGG